MWRPRRVLYKAAERAGDPSSESVCYRRQSVCECVCQPFPILSCRALIIHLLFFSTCQVNRSYFFLLSCQTHSTHTLYLPDLGFPLCTKLSSASLMRISCFQICESPGNGSLTGLHVFFCQSAPHCFCVIPLLVRFPIFFNIAVIYTDMLLVFSRSSNEQMRL